MGDSILLNNLRDFSGTGLLFLLLLIGVLFLGFYLKRGPVKRLVVWYPVFVLAIYFCPLWYFYFRLREDSEILYRLLWMIPFSVVICYALVEVIFLLPKKIRVVSFSGALVLIMLCGKYLYTNPQFSKAENPYHVPETVVKICDEIEVPGREIRACFPIEFIQYVRQYSPYVCLAYGRTVLLGDGFNEYSRVDELLHDEVLNTRAIVDELRRVDTPYFIVSSDTSLTENPGKYEFYYVTTIDGYDIYLDNNVYIGVDFINYS